MMNSSNNHTKNIKRRTKFDEFALSLLKWGSIGLAIFAVIVGIISLFWDEILGQDPDKAVIWFALAVIAVLVPFIREITIKDIHLVLKDLEDAKEMLEATTLTSRLLQDRLTATRAELINGYKIYLEQLQDEERIEKIIEMSQLYINEMGLEIRKIKRWLKELEFELIIDEKITTSYIDVVKAFQKKIGLEEDGILGYQTYDRLISALKNKRKQNED